MENQGQDVPQTVEQTSEVMNQHESAGSWWIAFMLTLLAPAVGGTYASARVGMGLRFLGWSYTPYLLFFVFVFYPNFIVLLLVLIASLVMHIALAGKANEVARVPRERKKVGLKMLTALGISMVVNIVAINIVPVEMFRIPSTSMLPNFEVGDRIVVNRMKYGLWNPITRTKHLIGKPPQRGEVIVFLYPPDPSRVFIKRVIGVPGDTISVRDNKLTLNGKPIVTKSYPKEYSYNDYSYNPTTPTTRTLLKLSETIGPKLFLVLNDPGAPSAFSNWSSSKEAKLGARPWGPVVPPGHVFVLGDNRDYSSDSREWGLVKYQAILGRVESIFLSFGPDSTIRWGRTGKKID